jgi:hypothetical protein
MVKQEEAPVADQDHKSEDEKMPIDASVDTSVDDRIAKLEARIAKLESRFRKRTQKRHSEKASPWIIRAPDVSEADAIASVEPNQDDIMRMHIRMNYVFQIMVAFGLDYRHGTNFVMPYKLKDATGTHLCVMVSVRPLLKLINAVFDVSNIFLIVLCFMQYTKPNKQNR